MSEKRISHVVGKGSLTHNNRCFFAKNVDISRTPQNVEIIRIPLAKAYDDLFSKSVERYNDKQTRKCRRIDTDYFFHLFTHKVCDYTLVANNKQKSFYEDLVQVGDIHDTGCGTPDAEIAKQCLIEYAEHYIKNNPNFYVFNAVIHMDEATPHLHINYIPVGHYSKGLDTRNAMAKALEEMGYTGINAATKWREHERTVFTEICKSHGLEIAAPQKSRGYNFTVDEYKDIQEEKKRLTEELQPLREMELAADESVIVGKKQLLSHNITVTPEELQQLETQKKAVAVQQIDNQREKKHIERREEDLHKREAEVSADLTERTKELDERETGISQKEERLASLISEAEQLKYDADILHERAEHDFERAKEQREFQRDLNQKYSELSDKLCQSERENFNAARQFKKIRDALNIPYTATNEEAVERCREIVDEKQQLEQCISKELHLSYQQRKSIKLPDMLKMLIDNFKDKLKTAEIENEENKSVIGSLREAFANLKNEFIKVVLGINTLVYDKKYSSGLSGFSKALAKGISLFIDKCFEQREEFDLIDKCEIDNQIKENMQLFIERTKDKNYYER